nr:MAG TPA: hypothetical protein [Caudoviricetes sp.]
MIKINYSFGNESITLRILPIRSKYKSLYFINSLRSLIYSIFSFL